MLAQKRKKMNYIIAIITLIVIAIIILIFKNAPTYEHLDLENSDNGNVCGPILSTTFVEQTIIPKTNGFCRIDVFMATYARINTSNITFQVFDEENNLIYNQIVLASEIGDSTYHTLRFDPVFDSKGKLFTFALTSDTEDADNAITAWISDVDCYKDGALYINNTKTEFDIAFKLYYNPVVDASQLLVFALIAIVVSSVFLVFYNLMLFESKNQLIDLTFWLMSACGITWGAVAVYDRISCDMFRLNTVFTPQSFLIFGILFPSVLIITSIPFFCSDKKHIDKPNLKTLYTQDIKQIVLAIIVIFVFSFMLLVYEPIITYSFNKNEFLFDLEAMMKPLLFFACLGFLVGSSFVIAVFLLIKRLSIKTSYFQYIVITIFIIFFATYIQGNWLAKDLPILTGEVLTWDAFSKNDITTGIVWLVLLASAICFTKKLSPSRMIKISALFSSVIFIMLFSGMTVGIISNNAFQDKDGMFIPTYKNFNVVSNNKNFLIFLVDAVDSRTFNSILSSNEEAQKVFEDFTYYENTMSAYAYTKYSLPVILANSIKKDDMDYLNFSALSYNNSELFRELEKRDYEINIYDVILKWAGNRNYIISNAATTSMRLEPLVDYKKFIREEVKYVAFKYLPYSQKKLSRIETANLDRAFAFEEKTIPIDNYFDWSDKKTFDYIVSNPTLEKKDCPMFQFVHVEGAHLPMNYDEELNEVEIGTYRQKVAASIKLIDTYIQRLKNNLSYNNSVIIVMSDHGYYDNVDQDNNLPRFNPILLIKGINEQHDLIKSDLPISYINDLMNAYFDLLEEKPSTELFTHIPSQRTRTIFSDLWINGELYATDYITNGKAYEWEKFELVGNLYNCN